ncbi:unnamed protein product, partial [Prorocentrum cordatum]
TSPATLQKASKGISKSIVTKIGCALDKSDHWHELMDNAMLMGQFIRDHGGKISQMEKDLSQVQRGHDGATDALACMMAQLGKWSQIAPFPTCLDVVSGELGVAARGRVKVAEVTASTDAIDNVPFAKDLSVEDAVKGATAEGGISVLKLLIVKLTASVEGVGAVSEVPDELKQKMSGFKPFLLALLEAKIGGDGFNEVQVCVDEVFTSRALEQVVNWTKVNQLYQALHSVILKHGAFVQTGVDGNVAHAYVTDVQILVQKGHEYRTQSFTDKINERLRIFGPTSKGGDGDLPRCDGHGKPPLEELMEKAAELPPLKKMSAHVVTYKQLEK